MFISMFTIAEITAHGVGTSCCLTVTMTEVALVNICKRHISITYDTVVSYNMEFWCVYQREIKQNNYFKVPPNLRNWAWSCSFTSMDPKTYINCSLFFQSTCFHNTHGCMLCTVSRWSYNYDTTTMKSSNLRRRLWSLEYIARRFWLSEHSKAATYITLKQSKRKYWWEKKQDWPLLRKQHHRMIQENVCYVAQDKQVV